MNAKGFLLEMLRPPMHLGNINFFSIANDFHLRSLIADATKQMQIIRNGLPLLFEWVAFRAGAAIVLRLPGLRGCSDIAVPAQYFPRDLPESVAQRTKNSTAITATITQTGQGMPLRRPRDM